MPRDTYSNVPRHHMVELVGRYSNLSQQMTRVRTLLALDRSAWSERSEPEPFVPFRVEQRLSDKQISQLVAEYEAGTSGRQLAERYGLARSTVIAMLKERGVGVRYPRFTEVETERAIALYKAGVRQIDIARELGRSKSAVWHVLHRAGLV
jgi:biotin operon repressor